MMTLLFLSKTITVISWLTIKEGNFPHEATVPLRGEAEWGNSGRVGEISSVMVHHEITILSYIIRDLH